MNAPPRPQAVAYIRRSIDKQDQSLPQQIDFAKRRAESGGYHLEMPEDLNERIKHGSIHQVGDVYLDDAVSGAVERRPGLMAMLRRIRRDKSVKFLIVWDRTRLGRFERNEVGMALEKDLRESGVTLV